MPIQIFSLAVLLIGRPGPSQQADPALAQLKQADSLSGAAGQYFDAKQYAPGNEARAKGIISYQKAIELNPRLVEAYRHLGDLYRRNTSSARDFQHAAESYQKALEIKPDAETSNRLGVTYTSLGKAADAIPAFEEAARLDPSIAMFQYNLGFSYTELAKLDEARKVVARLQPKDQALARKLLDRIGRLSGESSLAGRPASYRNPKIELVAIPGGNTIKGFSIGKYPVTQGEWQMVMGDNPSFFKTCGERCPVEQVSWNDAQAFVTRLNQLRDGHRYRLPTEAEWEYAYRGGTKTLVYATGDIGWHSNNSGGTTHPVGEKPANPFGLFDMGGHVEEWCQDPVEGEPLYRVLRGSSFYVMGTMGVRARDQGRVDAVSRNNGFRVVAEKGG